jgi:hypothetical protein
MKSYLFRNKTLKSGTFVAISLVALFFITRGSTPHASELSYTDHSILGDDAGSVAPASCDMTNFPNNLWQGYNCVDAYSCLYEDPKGSGNWWHSGDHFPGDCTTGCPGDPAHSYDPYADPGHASCPPIPATNPSVQLQLQ